jgi:hypothetical protein
VRNFGQERTILIWHGGGLEKAYSEGCFELYFEAGMHERLAE